MEITLLEKIKQLINSENIEDIQLVKSLKKIIYDFDINSKLQGPSIRIADQFKENAKYLKDKLTNPYVYDTGFENLNQLAGFSRGELVIIGGRPAVGKTMFLVNLVSNLSEKLPVLYFTFDMSAQQFTNRMIAKLADISIEKLSHQEISQEERVKIEAQLPKFQQKQLYINDGFHHSIFSFQKFCEQEIKEKGIQMIFVDYLQMMTTGNNRNNREFEISTISRALKNLARENNICVVATSQLSRAVETRGGDKRPMLSDLRESGAIEQDADKVMFLYRPSYYGMLEDELGNSTVGLMECIIAKNRNGKCGSVNMLINEDFTAIREKRPEDEEFKINDNRMLDIFPPF